MFVQSLLLSIILAVAVLALLIHRLRGGLLKGHLNDGMLIVALPSDISGAKKKELLTLIEKRLPKGRVDSIADNDEESVLSYSFVKIDKNTMLELNSELKTIDRQLKSNMYFHRSGEV